MHRWAAAVGTFLVVLTLPGGVGFADTTTSLGDRSGEGSTPFTGVAQAPEATLYTGALATSVPIQVPPGRKNMTPQLALTYSSSGGPGAIGYGWDLPIGRIERSTKFGVPDPNGTDFVLVMPTGAFELMQTSSPSTYRPQYEHGYLSAEWSGSEPSSRWDVYDASGMHYVFGSDPSTRIEATQDGIAFVTVWALNRIEDPNGNNIDFVWDDVASVLYPKEVNYGGNGRHGVSHFFHVTFGYESLPTYNHQAQLYSTSMVNNRNGAEATLTKRLRSITIRTDRPPSGQPTLIRTYSLLHTDDAWTAYPSRLTEVRVTGPDGPESSLLFPSQGFAYAESITGHDEDFTTLTLQTFPAVFNALRSNSGNGRIRQSMMDMNGDGMVDLVDAANPDIWHVYLGSKTGMFSTTAFPWTIPLGADVPESGQAAIRKTDGQDEGRCRADTLDMTGDGIPDYVVADVGECLAGANAGGTCTFNAGDCPGGTCTRQICYRGTNNGNPCLGNGHCPGGTCSLKGCDGGSSNGFACNTDSQCPGGACVDTTAWLVFPGKPPAGQNGWRFSAQDKITWTSPARYIRIDETSTQSTFNTNTRTTQDLVDVNADGRPDLLVAPGGVSTPPPYTWHVYLNEGGGFSADPVNHFAAPSQWISAVHRNNAGQGDDEHGWVEEQVADFNGDGLPDFLKAFGHSLEVYAGIGRNGFSSAPVSSPLSGGYIREWNGYDTIKDLLDLNGDGLPDRVELDSSPGNSPNPDNASWLVTLNEGGRFRWNATPEEWPGLAGRIRRQTDNYTTWEMVDVNGDGLLDRVHWVNTGGTTEGYIQFNQETPQVSGIGEVTNSATRPHLLVATQTGLGGTHLMRYRPSTRYDNTGGDGIPDLPSITWVVTDIRRTDGLCQVPPGADPFATANTCIADGHEVVEQFVYQDGRFNPVARDFLGFRVVYAIQRNDLPGVRRDNAEKSTFSQNIATRGKLLRRSTFAGNAAATPPVATELVHHVEEMWTVYNLPEGNQQLHRWLAIDSRFDTSHPNTSHYRNTYTDIDEIGNVTRSWTEGVAGIIETNTEYAQPSGTSRVRDKPKHAWSTYQPAGKPTVKFLEKWFYYDGAALGTVAEGNVTQVESLVSDQSGQKVHSHTSYDVFGNIEVVENELGAQVTTQYDASRLHPTLVTNDLGHSAQTVTDYRWGKPLSVTDPNGATTQHHYDDAGRPLCVFRPDDPTGACPPSGSSKPSVWYEYSYADGATNLDSKVVIHHREPNHSSGYLTVTGHYDALGRHRYAEEQRIVSCQASATTVITGDTEYDAGSRVHRTYVPYPAPFGSRSNGARQMEYYLNGDTAYIDPLDRIHKVHKPDGSVLTTTYDRATTTAFDEAGIKSVATIDTFGRTIRTEAYDAQGALYSWTETEYDGAGRVLTTEMNGNDNTEVQHSYDLLGRKLETDDPDSKLWRYGYDAAGNLVFQDDPRANQSIELCYDSLNRLVGKYYRTGTTPTQNICGQDPDVLYQYDAFESTSGGNKGKGRLTHVRDLSGETDYTYDLRGRTTSQMKTIYGSGNSPGTTYATTEWEFDSADHVVAIHYPGGEVVTPEYDQSGQPRKLSNTEADPIVNKMCWDILGRPTKIEHGNGVVDSHTYAGNTGTSSAFRLSNISVQKGSASKYLDVSYSNYDPRGLLGKLTDTTPRAAALSNQLNTITYDHFRRLKSAVGPNLNETYSYDALGNLTAKGNRTFTPSITKPHQIESVSVVDGCNASTEAVDYDDNGNRHPRGSTTILDHSFDHENRLKELAIGANTVRFKYDDSGRETVRTVSSTSTSATRYYNDLAETTSSGVYRQYYYLGGIRVATRITTDVSWEDVAALDLGIHLASAPVDHPGLVVLLDRTAQSIALLIFAAVALPLAVAPWRRRRVVGMRVRHGHALGVALATLLGTLPCPILFAPAPAMASTTSLRHLHFDHLQSTQVITDHNGSILQQIRYEPYGKVRGYWNALDGSTIALPNFTREFTGYEREAVSGLQYAGERFYDPVYATFLTHDPASEFASPYTYTNWNPLNVVDPNGAYTDVAFIVAIAVNAITISASIANAVRVGIAANDVGVAFKAAAINQGVSAVSFGLGAIVSFTTIGVGSTIQTSVALAGIGIGAYSTYTSAASGDYFSAAVGGLTLALSAVMLAYGLLSSVSAQGADQAREGRQLSKVAGDAPADPSLNPYDPIVDPHEHYLWENFPEFRPPIDRAMNHPLEDIPIKDWWADPRLRAIHEREGYWSMRTTGSHTIDLRFGNVHLTYDTVEGQSLPFLHYDQFDPANGPFDFARHVIHDVLRMPVDYSPRGGGTQW